MLLYNQDLHADSSKIVLRNQNNHMAFTYSMNELLVGVIPSASPCCFQSVTDEAVQDFIVQ